jgi:hypothetical protein
MVNVSFRPEANIRWLTSAFTSARPVSHAATALVRASVCGVLLRDFTRASAKT